jgi:serine protease Do
MPTVKAFLAGLVVATLAATGCSAAHKGAGAAPASEGGPAAAAQPPAPRVAPPDFAQLAERVGPAVVNVTTTRDAKRHAADDPIREDFRRFVPDWPGGLAPFRRRGLGSGFIISADGYVLTNAHVVRDAGEVIVRLAGSKREYKAKIVGADRPTDVALLKVDGSGLPTVELGSVEDLEVGAWVVAMGLPFGFDNTITAGVVSAKRRWLPNETYVPFIQTDAVVNPGSSGGPLLDLAGEVVGINSHIYTRTGGYMGVSFAIPIDVAMEVAEQLRAHGVVTRGRLGVRIQKVTRALADSFGLDVPRGALLASVEPNSPADRAGLAAGDIILAYAGRAIASVNELLRLIARTVPGNEAQLEVWRNGKTRTIRATVGAATGERAGRGPEGGAKVEANRLGLVLSPAPPAQREQLGIEFGLVVESLRGAAADSALRRGDVIVAVNEASFDSVAQFDALVADEKPGEAVALLVRRGEASLYVPLKVGPG